MPDTLPPRTHNQPPLPTPDEIAQQLTAEHASLRDRQAEILAGCARFVAKYGETGIPDDDVAGRAADFAAGKGGAIGLWLKACENTRELAKSPWLAGGNAVQTFFRGLAEPVEREQRAINLLRTAYATKKENQAREAARKAAEEAHRRAAEAEAAALANMDSDALDHAAALAEAAERATAQTQAKPAEFSRVHGSATVSSLRTTWTFVEAESDLLALVKAVAAGKAPLEYLAFNSARIGYAVRSERKRQIPGCVIREIKTV